MVSSVQLATASSVQTRKFLVQMEHRNRKRTWRSVFSAMEHRNRKRTHTESASSSEEDTPAASSGGEAARRCLGVGLCPWCSVGCNQAEHGNLKQAQIHYLSAVGEAKKLPADQRLSACQEYCLMRIRRSSLWSCAVQVDGSNPTTADAEMVNELIRDKCIPAREKWIEWSQQEMRVRLPSLPPPEPSSRSAAAERLDTDEEASQDDVKKQWYEAPLDEQWRLEPWVKDRPGHRRIVEVLISKNKKKWVQLQSWLTDKVLEVYDQENIGAKSPDYEVETDFGLRWFAYRVEGAEWLTQWDAQHPSNHVRQVRVRLEPDRDRGVWWR